MPINEVRLKARTLRGNWRNRVRKSFKKTPELVESKLESLPTIDEVQQYLETVDLTKDYLTGERIPTGKYELDHKVPLARNGSLALDNIGPCTKRNNKMKGELTESEYLSLRQTMASWPIEGVKVLEKRLNQSTIIFKPKVKK